MGLKASARLARALQPLAISAGDTVSVNFYPAGEGAGNAYYSGTVVVTGAPVSAKKDEFVLQSFSFKGTGALSTGALT